MRRLKQAPALYDLTVNPLLLTMIANVHRYRGTLPGSMRALVEIGATIGGSFTFYLQDGTLKGHGVATPHGAGVYESFAGTVTITGGTGRFIHAHGHTGLYGTFDRNTYALTIQTTGTFSY